MKIPVSNIKKKLKYLAKEFNLKYDSKWFDFELISRQDKYLDDFVSGCPDPDYNSFGKTSNVRVRNLNRFLNSKIYAQEISGLSGSVKSKKDVNKNIKTIKLIKNKDIKNRLLVINKKAKANKSYLTVLLTKPKTRKDLKFILWILLHEWEHVLLMKNNIYFQKKGKKYWIYDEGLVTYCDAFLNKDLNKLKSRSKREKRPMTKIYLVNALKFKKLLENKDAPKERKKAILNYYKSLPKRKIK